MRRVVFLWLMTWLVLTVVPAHSGTQSLQAMIDGTPSGATLRLAPGVYQGPVNIGRTMVLDGGNQATIQGDGHSTVLSVQANGVTLRGLKLRGSGDSPDRIDAGVLLQGNDHRVEGNLLEDVLFGIHLKGVDRSLIKNNRVTGKALPLGQRGDAIRLWYSHNNRIEDNQFQRARDLTLINSPDNRVTGNQFTDGRYGLHMIFSPRLLIENNRLTHTGTGIVALYSPNVTLRRNYVAHALTDGGAGIVIKESPNSVIEDNQVLHCSIGLKADASTETADALVVRGNQFAYNIIGLFFYGEVGGHRFSNNRFDNNLTTVAVSAPGAGSGNQWQDNLWDEYQGFDRNRDGVGDTPHEAFLFADRIWMETPITMFFRNSPVLEMLDFLERLAPFSSPHRLLRDPTPRWN